MPDRRGFGRPFALLAIAVALVGCGGTASATPVGATPTPTPPAATEPATGATATPDAGATPDASAFAFPSFDISQLASGLENVDSYRVSITVDGKEQYKGVVVTKPVLSRDITLEDGTRIIVIGNEAWISGDGTTFTPAPGQMATAMFAAFDPTLMVGMFSGPQWAQSSQLIGTEQKNGIAAKHYHLDSTTAVSGFTGVPAGAMIDLWIADEGYLVGLEADGFGGGALSIQVTGVDDPANKVETPN